MTNLQILKRLFNEYTKKYVKQIFLGYPKNCLSYSKFSQREKFLKI